MNFYSSNFVGWDILNGSPCTKGDSRKTPKEALGTLLYAHFPGAKIKSEPRMEPKPLKSSTKRTKRAKGIKVATRIVSSEHVQAL